MADSSVSAGGPMIAVCLAPADLRPEVDDLTGAVSYDDRRASLTPAEATALEYALRAASEWKGWVLAVACGPPEVDPVLAEVAALGASVVRIPPHSDEPSWVATALSAAISSHGEPALVLCGDRSAVRGVGAVPGLLAHHLGLPQALGLVSLSLVSQSLVSLSPVSLAPAPPLGPHRSVLAERRLDGGWRERLRVDGPAVLSVEGGSVRLRRAPLSGVLDPVAVSLFDANPPAPTVTVGSPRPYRPRTRVVPAPTGGTRERLLALSGGLSDRDPPRVVGPLDPAGAADELLSYLARLGVVPK